MTGSSKYRECDLCGETSADLRFRKDGYSIVECRNCGLVYVGESTAQLDFSHLYGEAYYQSDDRRLFHDYLGEAEERISSARSRVESLLPSLPKGRLLDVGCAAGFFLQAARQHYETVGVELSDFSSSYARDQFGLDVITGTLEQARFPEESFDVVTMWDVIEHVSSPQSLLMEVARILKPGGCAVVATGDVESVHARLAGSNWELFAPPWHLYYFSRKTLDAMAHRAGLNRASLRTSGVIARTPLLNNRFVNRFVNFFRLGDVMQVILRK